MSLTPSKKRRTNVGKEEEEELIPISETPPEVLGHVLSFLDAGQEADVASLTRLGIYSSLSYGRKDAGAIADAAARRGNIGVLLHLSDTLRVAWDGGAALVVAARVSDFGMIKYLVEVRGADVHHDNDMAVWHAARRGDLAIVQYLVAHGANIHGRWSTTHMAVVHGHEATARFLVGMGGAMYSSHESIPLQIATYDAMRDENYDYARFLLDHMGPGGGRLPVEPDRGQRFSYSSFSGLYAKIGAAGSRDMANYVIHILGVKMGGPYGAGIEMLNGALTRGKLEFARWLLDNHGQFYQDLGLSVPTIGNFIAYGSEYTYEIADLLLDVRRWGAYPEGFIVRLIGYVIERARPGRVPLLEQFKYLVGKLGDSLYTHEDGIRFLTSAVRRYSGPEGVTAPLLEHLLGTTRGKLPSAIADHLLREASLAGNLEAVKYTVGLGANVFAEGSSPWVFATALGYDDVAKYLWGLMTKAMPEGYERYFVNKVYRVEGTASRYRVATSREMDDVGEPFWRFVLDRNDGGYWFQIKSWKITPKQFL